MKLTALILAAGKGTRMKSNLPKVLHKVNGKPMLECVVSSVKNIGVEDVVIVVGHGAEEVKTKLGDDYNYVLQAEQLGTGHAVMMAADVLAHKSGDLLVVCGDTPLLTPETLQSLYEKHRKEQAACTILTAVLDNPYGYGRIIRDESGNVRKIVEEKDASAEERLVKEVNTGSYCFNITDLFDAINRLSPANAQGEYYLTDVIADFKAQGKVVSAYITPDFSETLGINSKAQLAEASAVLRQRKLNELMSNGVTIIDPHTTYIEEEVRIAADAIIYPMCFISGKTSIGTNSEIGPGCKISDSEIGSSCEIQFSVLNEVKMGNNCNVGPYAYLRPGTVLEDNVKVGDFAEIKNSYIGEGSKIPHLSYVGDAELGRRVNIGAGTITCNYDGVRKHQTVIGDDAFIGSNTNLVAPVKIGEKAVTGAGSTITKDVPAYALAVERAVQKIRADYRKESKNVEK